MDYSATCRLAGIAALASLLAVVAACSNPNGSPDAADTGDAADISADADAGDTADGESGPVSGQLVHQFEDRTLKPGEESIPCVQWTLDNEKPLYVNRVTMANEGGFHHSNWYVVPESYVSGPDGYFDCSERGYRGFTAATRGTVLFAQSTQAKSEVQEFPPGVVTKIPPNHKIVADVHFLNITPRTRNTSVRLTLGLMHPRDVETVATPFVLSYNALDIPPESEARFTAECSFRAPFQRVNDEKMNFKIYYVLPHYHGLGNYFGLEVFGGPRDGEQLFELQGFDAEANGHQFNPPAEITKDAKGLRFTCGFDNPRDERVTWGIGGNEMCMMLGFTNANAVMAGRVPDDNQVLGEKDGIIRNTGKCSTTAVDPSDGQQPPTQAEKEGDLYIPESDTDEELDPIPECKDRPGTADPLREPRLTNLKTDLFRVGCAFSSCHDGEAPAAGLNLAAEDLHSELMNHKLITPTDDPLVTPGKPEESWLYRVTSRCKPQTTNGTTSHMPKNSPTLLDPEVLAMVREWIERGAKDN